MYNKGIFTSDKFCQSVPVCRGIYFAGPEDLTAREYINIEKAMQEAI